MESTEKGFKGSKDALENSQVYVYDLNYKFDRVTEAYRGERGFCVSQGWFSIV